MKTQWSDKVDINLPLNDYPRPQMVRESWLNLNGQWDYAVTKDDCFPEKWDGKITVPFSPECQLSGVNRIIMPDDVLWYRRTVELQEISGRVLLHFGAVDQLCEVYIGDVQVAFHEGGYTPFSVDITEQLQASRTLTVKVKDPSDTGSGSRGKQTLKRGGIWYTVQSGIWQTVWLEQVPEQYIRSLRLTPLFDERELEITVFSDTDAQCLIVCDGREHTIPTNTACRIPANGAGEWTPETPCLCPLSVTLGEDRVDSYFAMRKFSAETDSKGIKRLFLNNRPYFHNGLLDQGYWSDGMYTAPCDEALIFDIQTAKDMGFNMLRKHIKIEPLRWYYHCDRLGMLVWQDMINGGGQYSFMTISTPLVTKIHSSDSNYRKFARQDAHGREQYDRELDEMIEHLYNCPCIAMWVPFNEGWGQFDAAKATSHIRSLDPTRTIDHASGWHDQGVSDVKSLHVYFMPYRFKKDRHGRAVVLSEFGGYNLRIDGHAFNEKDFGYKRYQSPEALMEALTRLYEREIIPAVAKGLSATVYTQLTDVEDELNGLITYDRQVIKLNCDAVRALIQKVKL